MIPIRFVSAAREDLNEDALWYEQREAGLGMRFLDEVRHTLERIVADPESHPQVDQVWRRRNVRRCSVAVFPYQVIFEIRPEEIVVLAVAHGSRRPGYWSRRKG